MRVLAPFLLLVFLAVPRSGDSACDVSDNVPDSTLCTVPDAITVTPDGALSYSMIIEGPLGPVVGDTVTISFSGAAESLIAWNPDVLLQPPFTGITDAGGGATFNIRGGGCVDYPSFGGAAAYIAEVRVRGRCGDGTPYDVRVGTPYVNSPDAVNPLGLLPTGTWMNICSVDSLLRVGLSDAVFHTDAIKDALVSPCTDFTVPFGDPVGLADAVLLHSYVAQGKEGPCEP